MKLRSGKDVGENGLCPECKLRDDGDVVQCENGCQLWYHVGCVGLTIEEANELPEYLCNKCRLAKLLHQNNANDDSIATGFENSNTSTVRADKTLSTIVPPCENQNRNGTGNQSSKHIHRRSQAVLVKGLPL